MSARQDILAAARQLVVEHDKDAVEALIDQAVNEGMDPMELLNEGFIPGINEVGDQFGRGILFLPELIQSAEVMQIATTRINELIETPEEETTQGRILIATVEGDVHDIGKTIVVSLFKANGFEVLDLGRDVANETIISEAEKFNADIIGTSALLTTTMEQQKKLEQLLRQQGLKNKYKTIVGGAPCTQRWANRIGADAYAQDAADGVQKALQLLAANG